MNFEELLNATDADRTPTWEESFLSEFPAQNVSLIYEDAKPGPDNWPYLWVTTDTQGKKEESVPKLIEWLSSRGIGLVLNPNKQMPDYIFPYGMLWHFQQNGAFSARVKPDFTNNQELNFSKKDLSYGYPTQDYVPDYVRKILRDFFLQQGLVQVKWVMLTKDQKNYDLCFSLESLKSPPQKEHQGILEAISWFLPNHFQLAIVSEKDLPIFKAI